MTTITLQIPIYTSGSMLADYGRTHTPDSNSTELDSNLRSTSQSSAQGPCYRQLPRDIPVELCIRGLTPQATNTYIYIHTWQWISWVTPWARTWALMIHLLDKRTQKRGKWDWVSHHYSEPKLPSPRLRQDHSWSMPTRGHKSRLIPWYPASPHPPHPGPWPTRTGLLYWLTTIQQGQMNPSCRESEVGIAPSLGIHTAQSKTAAGPLMVDAHQRAQTSQDTQHHPTTCNSGLRPPRTGLLRPG